LATKLNKPVFLHERAAHEEFLKIMSKYPKIKACVHCFTGTKKELEEYLKRGYYIGITGFICNDSRGKELQQIIRLVPLNRLMVETDAPFMTPRNMKPPFDRIKRNEPAFLPVVVQKIAECMKKSVEEVAEATRKTTMEFFGLK
jgi:TatD DNase family protein